MARTSQSIITHIKSSNMTQDSNQPNELKKGGLMP